MQTQAIELNPFQQNVLLVPEECDLFLGGGRGGGKSWALALLVLRAVEQYGSKCRALYVRQTYKGLADFELVCRELFSKVYGTAARYNAADHVWRFPNGAYFELAQLEGHGDTFKFQGRSFTLLLADEIGQYADMSLLDLLRSNLRGPKDVPVRVVFAANPGGPNHFSIANRYVFKAAPWTPFFEPKSKRQWVYAPSTFSQNHFIDREQYGDQLDASCPGDPELLRAWKEGDWTINRGAYFASVLSEERNAIDPWTEIPKLFGGQFDPFIAMDYGSSAPAVVYVCVQSPGAEVNGRFYPRDSIILLDELATNRGDQLNVGLGWIIPILAEEITAMCKRWKIKPNGVADDACFSAHGMSAGSIADEFARCGVYFRPAKKADRISGWSTMRRLLADAGKPDVPGLYISRSCSYFWQTVPYLGRDMKRIEDIDSSGPDHAADAARYAVLRLRNRVRTDIIVVP